MKASRHLGLFVTLLAACVHAQKAPDLQANLARLDASSKNFVNFQADLEQDTFTRLVHSTEKATGKMYSIRGKTGDEVGIQVGEHMALYKNGTLKDYTTKLACYNTYSSGKNKSTFDTLLTLAFGTSGKALEDKWIISDKGTEILTVNIDGKDTPTRVEQLDLVPKEGFRDTIAHITLWIDLAKDYSPKLITYSPSGDTTTAIYSNIRLNAAKVETKPFVIQGKPCK